MKEDSNSVKPSGDNQKLFISGTNQEFEIPLEGSLGLLALGAAGMKAWREKKKSVSENNQKENNSDGGKIS